MSRSLALLASVALVDGTSFARLQHAGFSIALASVLAQPVSSFQVNGPLRMASVRRSLAVRCQEGVPAKEEDPAPAVSDGMCALCGSKLFPNCNGQGRVVGGLTAIDVGGIKPFEWWPIKAYRPCPTAAAKGVRYSRVGQSLDEIVFKKNPKGGYCMCPARRHFASH